MKSIILVGFMGSGKSTVGKALSEISGLPLIDTDKYIQEKFAISICEFFEKYGEDKFRKAESEALEALLSGNDEKIISTGGGLPIFCENKALFEKGFTVYLEVTPETVIKRLDGDTTRPLLNGNEKLSKVRELLAFRAPIYKGVSKMTVNAENDAKNIAENILSAKNNLE